MIVSTVIPVAELICCKVRSGWCDVTHTLYVCYAGIGGFIAKPRQRAPPKVVVYGPITADGQPPVLINPESAAQAPTAEQSQVRLSSKMLFINAGAVPYHCNIRWSKLG